MAQAITNVLSEKGYLIIDGALATELEARGCNLNSSLWSAEILINQPELIYQVHLDYFQAGADIAITSSYQASTAGLEKHGLTTSKAVELIHKSVELAKNARETILQQDPERICFIAGSVGPYGAFLADGSEYRGDYLLPENQMKDFHRPRIQALVDAGADLLACETIPSVREMEALLDLLTEFPDTLCWVSFTLKDDSHISDGTPLSEVVKLMNNSTQVLALGFNCVPENLVSKALSTLSKLTSKPLLAYPNSGEIYDATSKTWNGNRAEGSHLGDRVKEWHGLGAKLIGGCCRTTPKDIQTIQETLKTLSEET
ncbi:homocysteine S-methyltransferase [Tothia fuscella]|uniref:Homocysteine S-methyltransferase n=1 Tax=Tothia fuscella TaxID=1048955 RepID=A0A9P4NNR2_9PEZI|nr:homocysteine S-methyltransferase [Tothia fuscella]